MLAPPEPFDPAEFGLAEGGQATQRTWKIMWNQINCFRRAVNATGEGEGEEGARSIAQSYECVCVCHRSI